MNVLDALEYTEMGLYVLPIEEGGKVPYQGLGLKHATCVPGVAERWFWDNSKLNLAIACAPSGLLVVDVDGPVGVQSMVELAEKCGPLPSKTPWVKTPNGWHIYFAAPGGVSRFSGQLLPNVDLKFNGYVVAPPSWGTNRISGGPAPYRWVHGRDFHHQEPAELPEHIWDRATLENEEPAKDYGLGSHPLLGVIGLALYYMRRTGAPYQTSSGAEVVPVECLWSEEHSEDKRPRINSGTVVYGPPPGGGMHGFYKCAHSNSCGPRLEALPRGEQWKTVFDRIEELDRPALDRAKKELGWNGSGASATSTG